MQDEVNEKVVAISVKASGMTLEILQKAIIKLLQEMKTQKGKTKHGQQTLKQLMKQDVGVSNIEITDGNIKGFTSIAKKYGVDFALKKDMSENPPRYLVFFKGRDADVLTAVFKEFSIMKLKQNKPSVLETLAKAKTETSLQTPKEKIADRGLER